MKKPRKYRLPLELVGRIDQQAYDKWLLRKATAHVKRDRKRGNKDARVAAYKIAIHNAVSRSKGVDAYTGEVLCWERISQWRNTESRLGRRVYKSGFALLPTVDHKGDGSGPADFEICAWRTNDAKGDLTYDDFVWLCKRIVKYSRNVASQKA